MAAKHYLEMDGLRGVAAVSVALYHEQVFFGGFSFFGHGYLAVDFFFMLSGFVLAHAYGERLRALGRFKPFVIDRIIRLLPMLLVGALLGLMAAVVVGTVKPRPPGLLLAAATALNALSLPALWMPVPFIINDPVWSLFMELIANVAFGLSARFVNLGRLAIFVGLSVLCVLVLDAHYGYFAFGRTRHTMLGGVPRVFASFGLGMLLHRVHLAGVFANGDKRWWIAPALIASFVMMPTHAQGSVWYDPIIVFALYPVLILASAGSRDIYPPIARLSGEISYPLYVIHIPFMQLFQHAFLFNGRAPSTISVVASLIASLVAAAILLFCYDLPVRAYAKSVRTRYRLDTA